MNGQKPLVLVIDDEQGILDVVGRFAQRAGYEAITCASGRDAIAQLQTRRADLVMVDLPVLMTGYASVDTAVEAIKLGAIDYLSKPLDFARLEQLLTACATTSSGAAACCARERPGAAARVLRDDRPRPGDAGAVRDDPAPGAARPHRARHRRDRHRQGAGRAGAAPDRPAPRPAVRHRQLLGGVETLFESELFGHVRGAFTGATDHKPGLFELADGGTLFLDEIGELPLTVQAEAAARARARRGAPRRSLEPRRVNVHVIAATNRDLAPRSRPGGSAAICTTGSTSSR